MLSLTDDEPDVIRLEKQSRSIVKYAFQLNNRDPKDINSHITVLFEEVIGEPEDARSADCLWRNSYRCFNAWKAFCYHANTILSGMCIAMCWGCVFATTAFLHVWCFTPCLRCVEINTHCMKKCTELVCSCNQCFETGAKMMKGVKGLEE